MCGIAGIISFSYGESENLALGIRNLKAFKTLPAKALNVYDILSYDQLVLTGAALEKINEVLAI
jgi:large subunit ribosomal protein L4